MEKPLISVVMPAYNCEKTIGQAVDSVIAQTCPNWELLILDDRSTDGTAQLIEALQGKDERIRAFHNEQNQGVGNTRNRGVELAKGDWIAFLDSDDMWMPEKLEKQLALLDQNENAQLLFTGSGFMNESGEALAYVLHVPPRIDRKRLLRQNLVSCSSVLVKKEQMLQHPFPAQSDMHEDFAVWLQILREEEYACGVDEPLLIYRLSASSKSGNKLKAARMNWNTYRRSGLGLFSSLYYMGCYAVNGIRKYRQL